MIKRTKSKNEKAAILAYRARFQDTYDKSIDDLTQAINLRPNWGVEVLGETLPEVYFFRERADYHSKKGDYERAMADRNRAIAVDPSAVSYNNRGVTYAEKGDLNQAIADYSHALQIDAGDPVIYFNRGRAYERKGELSSAAADYKRSMELGNKDAPARLAALPKTAQSPAAASPSPSMATPPAPQPSQQAAVEPVKPAAVVEPRLEPYPTPTTEQDFLKRARGYIAKGTPADLRLARIDLEKLINGAWTASARQEARDLFAQLLKAEFAGSAKPASQSQTSTQQAAVEPPKPTDALTPTAAPQAAAPMPPPAVAPSPALLGKRVALVIGNSDYAKIGKLDNPTNDAKLIAGALQDAGFTLVGGGPRLDLDKTGFDAAVQEFGNKLQGADVALFYYAGHGVQVRGANFLAPVNANPTKEADVDFQMVDANVVLRQMESAGTKLNLVMLDACRNNPLSGRGLRASGGGLAVMQAPEGTLISFATQPGALAQDGSDGNSPYTKALAEVIRIPGLDILHSFNEVGLKVKKATGGAQQPWQSSSPIEGAFYFKPGS
jgi:tetratricopeptide (TPR) repeat protein